MTRLTFSLWALAMHLQGLRIYLLTKVRYGLCHHRGTRANLICGITERVYHRVDGVISFVAENAVRAVSSHTDPWLSKWYKDVSQSFPGLCGG